MEKNGDCQICAKQLLLDNLGGTDGAPVNKICSVDCSA